MKCQPPILRLIPQVLKFSITNLFTIFIRGSLGQSNDNGRVQTMCFPNVFAEPSTCVFLASPPPCQDLGHQQSSVFQNFSSLLEMLRSTLAWYSDFFSIIRMLGPLCTENPNSGDSERVPKTLSCLNQNDESIFSLSPKQSFLLVDVTFEPLIRFHHYYPVRPRSKYDLSK